MALTTPGGESLLGCWTRSDFLITVPDSHPLLTPG